MTQYVINLICSTPVEFYLILSELIGDLTEQRRWERRMSVPYICIWLLNFISYDVDGRQSYCI